MEQAGRKRKREIIELVPDGTEKGWEQERSDADSLLRSLHQAHVDKETLRKSLRGRWPRWPGDDSNAILDAERFVAESFLRDQDFDEIKSLVDRSIDLLGQEEQGCTEEQEVDNIDILGTISRLSDDGLLEALPKYLPRLQGKVLCSVLSILLAKETRAKNAPWLIKRINEEWTNYSQAPSGSKRTEKVSQKLLSVLRDPQSYSKAVPAVSFAIEASSSLSAATSAILQLEKLPLRCLHVILEILDEKPVKRSIGVLPVGGNKDRITSRIVSIVRRLLSDQQRGEALPDLVQKSLVVASVSAKSAFGHDGNLMDFLDPIPSELKDLHKRLLMALTDLKALNHGKLSQIYSELGGESMLESNRHSLMLRKPIRDLLLDCLLRSVVRSVPDEVKHVLKTIRELAKEQAEEEVEATGDCGPETFLTNQMKIDKEVEAVLVMSSHMQQVMLNWNDLALGCTGLNHPFRQSIANGSGCTGKENDTIQSQAEGGVTVSPSYPDNYCEGSENVEEQVHLIMDMSKGGLKEAGGFQEIGTLACTIQESERETDSHDSLVEEEQDITRLRQIADKTAEIGYMLVGCAMKKAASASGVALKKRVQKYLCGDIGRNGPACSELERSNEEKQLDMILAVAESIPAISPRTMTNVKRRLGVG